MVACVSRSRIACVCPESDVSVIKRRCDFYSTGAYGVNGRGDVGGYRRDRSEVAVEKKAPGFRNAEGLIGCELPDPDSGVACFVVELYPSGKNDPFGIGYQIAEDAEIACVVLYFAIAGIAENRRVITRCPFR